MPAASPSDIVLDTVFHFLRSFSKPGPLLIAISGGSDSTALLIAFQKALSEPAFSGFSLFACTIDHDLRPGSADEALKVKALSEMLGIPHSTRRWLGEKPSSAIQAEARAARYGLLCEAAIECGAIAVLTGHTMDDQNETIAMRQARGRGAGLSGMASCVLVNRSAWVLRPFLGLKRAELRAALKAWNQSWIDDPGNDNPRFERVRVRNEPGSITHISPPEVRLESATRQARWLQDHAHVHAGLVGQIDMSDFQSGDSDVEAALFRLASVIGGKIHLPSASSRKQVMARLGDALPGRLTIGGTVFDRRKQGLFLYRETRNLPSLQLAPGESVLWDGRYFLENHGIRPWHVRPVCDPEPEIVRLVESGVPSPVAKRAAPAALATTDEPDASAIRRERRIACYDAFLPGFDLPLAVQLFEMFGQEIPTALPLRQ